MSVVAGLAYECVREAGVYGAAAHDALNLVQPAVSAEAVDGGVLRPQGGVVDAMGEAGPRFQQIPPDDDGVHDRKDAGSPVVGLVRLFRARHAHVNVTIHESDLGDPTAGLRTGLVEVALTRTPPSTPPV
ncbi:hypothetical protein AB0E10_41700 [Streptomyces sp. NPDC048045]|uniref:hypothetical protein n=1 Tax=Streptomyces sp. NPDC048045 TaxID=3154710 RepID=UPI00342B38F2